MMGQGSARRDRPPKLKHASKTPSLVAQRPLEKRAVLVLGMHRSGTSAGTSLLNLLGADLRPTCLPRVACDSSLATVRVVPVTVLSYRYCYR